MVKIVTLTDNEYMFLVTKEEWTGRPVKFIPELQRKGYFENITVTCINTRTCGSRAHCSEELRKIQLADMDELQPDIKYNFLVGGYGTVYEGRGWHTLCEPIDESLKNTLSIAYIGRYSGRRIFHRGTPPFEMLSSVITLIKYGQKFGHITQKYTMRHIMPRMSSITLNDSPEINE